MEARPTERARRSRLRFDRTEPIDRETTGFEGRRAWMRMHDDARATEQTAADEIELVARSLEEAGRFGLTRNFIQHGNVSVYEHVRSVARASAAFASLLQRMGVRIDRASLIRGALLHDYFLYDWHDPDPSHRLHGFTHPSTALERASEDFELTERERNIIARHMFPLVPISPTCREAWIVCIADKACALGETIEARMPLRNRNGKESRA